MSTPEPIYIRENNTEHFTTFRLIKTSKSVYRKKSPLEKSLKAYESYKACVDPTMA